jgi:hypothetical protein
MASRTLVKNYIAQWMQMGKSVSLSTQGEQVSIYKILNGEEYSSLFNKLWDEISTTKADQAYLDGTDQTIDDLLSDRWEIIGCARCSLLVPSLDLGPRVPVCCPCDDLPSHPNLDLVAPHVPVKLSTAINGLCDRLIAKNTPQEDQQEPQEISSDVSYLSEAENSLDKHDLRNSIFKLLKNAPNCES